MGSYKIYWDLARSIEISQELLRSHKIYWDVIGSSDLASYISHFVFDIWHLTFDIEITWYLTFDISHFTFYIWPLTFDNCHLTLIFHDIDMPWHLTFDIDIPWHLTFDIDIPWHLTFDIWHWYTMTFDMTEGTDSTSTDTWYWHNHINFLTDGFWGYLQSKKMINCLTGWTI